MNSDLIESAANRLLWQAGHALTELEMCREADAIFGLLGLSTWGSELTLLIRPSGMVKEAEEGEFPSLAVFVLGQEYFVLKVQTEGEGSVYFVVEPEGERPPVFLTLPEALSHVLEHCYASVKTASAGESGAIVQEIRSSQASGEPFTGAGLPEDLAPLAA